MTARAARPPRVLVCDDSPLLRRVLTDLLTDGGLTVVGEARDGIELIGQAQALEPDVVTLDVEMPRRDGLAGLRELMRVRPTPVIMVSTLTGPGSAATVAALAAGAIDAVQKPALRLDPARWGAARDELVAKVRAAAGARVAALAPAPRPAVPGARLAARAGAGGPLVLIATSTGGPRALHAVLPQLPSPLGAGVVVVQHMPPGFTGPLADRLDAESALSVREAADSDEIRPDTALIAPAGWHLAVTARGRVRRSAAPPVGALRPRADITFATAARHHGAGIVAVVLTGMGDDGLDGVRAVARAGGRVIVEHERTCVVWGMPRAVEQAGLADAVVPLDAIPLAIAEAVSAAARPRARAAVSR
ncbi:chemotaxis-specific protein-glutamate methyltransferase CheB [Miltoncostaea marina]|uniref:chemotaxis-specific protein-glutamate methyltransferase CheB n=1 Tax=Miltoncostaea marina TaxID=2843215 RepID=UPI001C3DD7FF|nr:chemotaxis-specific protein-glutamate methyltransferase CheB [Miltoncostaea marina]